MKINVEIDTSRCKIDTNSVEKAISRELEDTAHKIERTAKEMRQNYPVEMVERAVKGMLPHNRLGREMYKKLFVYAGEDHKHAAQQPKVLEMGGNK